MHGIIELMQFIPIQEFVGTPVLSLEVTAATVFVLSVIGFTAGVMPAGGQRIWMLLNV